VNGIRIAGLALRLAISGGKPAWARLGLMVAGFAMGAALLLGAASLSPAARAHDFRRFSVREGTMLPGGGRSVDNALLVWPTNQTLGDLTFEAWAVQPRGNAPTPVGLTRIPLPGEAFVSPALAEILMGPNGPALEERLRAKPVGLIGDDGLVDPTELLAYVGKPPGGVLRGARPTLVTSFDHRVGTALPLDLAALLVIILLASVALIPLAIFIATVTRLSAGTREARFAAVRLAGGTQSQGIPCNMTGGSSGGPWFTGGLQNSINSFGYGGVPNTMFGPYWGSVIQGAYNTAAVA